MRKRIIIKITAGIAIILLLAVAGYYGWQITRGFYNPKGEKGELKIANLTQYDFNELKKRGGKQGKIEILGLIKGVEDRRKLCKDPKFCLDPKEINFETKQISLMSEGKKISGMINIPLTSDSRAKPVVIMVRGYADKAGYFSGSGSWRVADQFAHAGYVTVSLDFLGYANSDPESTDMLEARFEKVPALLDLIESVKTLGFVDKNRVGIWAHSNGGQIVLSALEVTGGGYPTVLWAPMTNPFPQSVLETASDLDDGGKAVISAISEFERRYDSRRYAFENYYEWIKAPVLIQQGTADEWCKVEWQREVVEKINGFGGKAELAIYQADDHNLTKNWKDAVEKDLKFFDLML